MNQQRIDASLLPSFRRIPLLLLLSLLWLTACGKAETSPTPSSGNPPEENDSAPAFELAFDNAPIDRLSGSRLNSYAPILKEAQEAVVAVYTAEVVRVVRRDGPTSMEEYLLRRFFGMPAPQRGPITPDDIEERRVPQGVGSGVIVSSDGYILTNNHVVSDKRGENADEVLVQLSDGREFQAAIVGRDPRTDIAILKIEGGPFPSVTLSDSDHTEVGDIVFAIGNPLGVGITVTQGIVSATGRAIGIYGEEGYEDFIQTDASINMGNSGGALVDIKGRLVGINSAILSRSGGNIGIGFAIPTNLAVGIARQLVEYGEVRRGYLGVTTGDLDPELADAFGLPDSRGALVNKVDPEGPAGSAGIRHGDVIVSVDGKPIENTYELRLRIGQLLPGTPVQLGVIRDGEPRDFEVLLEENTPFEPVEMVEGVFLAPMDPSLRARLQVPDSLDGVVIVQIRADTPFRRYFSLGMVIIEVNGSPVRQPEDVLQQLRSGRNRIQLFHQGKTGYIILSLQPT